MSSKLFKSAAMVSLLLIFSLLWVLIGGGVDKLNDVQAASDFAGGSGTVDDPYIIMTPAELNNVRFHLDSHFKLEADINLSGYNTGGGWEPIASDFNISDGSTYFRGSFDGDGFKVENLTINRVDENYQGLFAALGYEGVIRNVRLENVTIRGKLSVGSLVGINKGHIENVSVSVGTVEGERNVGGLIASIPVYWSTPMQMFRYLPVLNMSEVL